MAFDEVEKYQNFTNANFENVVQQGHMIEYGNLDRLYDDKKFYMPFIW